MKSIGEIFGSTSYASQIKDERWTAFAAGIRKQRNFCECCRRSGIVLQVHHLFYEFNRNLWDYDGDEVIVLCESCHKDIHEQLKQFRKHVFRYLNGQSFKVLNGALAVGLTTYDPLTFCHALAEFVSNKRLVENHARAWAEETPTTTRALSVRDVLRKVVEL